VFRIQKSVEANLYECVTAASQRKLLGAEVQASGKLVDLDSVLARAEPVPPDFQLILPVGGLVANLHALVVDHYSNLVILRLNNELAMVGLNVDDRGREEECRGN